jgi:hypothetical protein
MHRVGSVIFLMYGIIFIFIEVIINVEDKVCRKMKGIAKNINKFIFAFFVIFNDAQ